MIKNKLNIIKPLNLLYKELNQKFKMKQTKKLIKSNLIKEMINLNKHSLMIIKIFSFL